MFALDSKIHGAENSKETGHYPRNKNLKKKTKKKILKSLKQWCNPPHKVGKKNKVKTKVKQAVKMLTLLVILIHNLVGKYASFKSNNVKILLTSSTW